MTKIKFSLTMSLDGYVAGPQQDLSNPLGLGGMALHAWARSLDAFRRQHAQDGGTANASSQVFDELLQGVGAHIMGRNMFGPVRGAWPTRGEPWNGWWGAEPPYHVPVFVLTHYPRAPVTMQGGTTFTFVTEGIESALAQARAAAGSRDIAIAGGARTVRQYLAAGHVDEVNLS
ncbi:MAG TPA: dihydrofolate reductase family protein, partial [Kofleriaceae bacterium]|nr:dihydrofolate reductase family protein [Kofleriaceae bacterium]